MGFGAFGAAGPSSGRLGRPSAGKGGKPAALTWEGWRSRLAWRARRSVVRHSRDVGGWCRYVKVHGIGMQESGREYGPTPGRVGVLSGVRWGAGFSPP